MKNSINRRDFIKMAGFGSLFMALPLSLKAQELPHVVVVGGGFAGATCAKYLKLWGRTSINVTLIEPNAIYTSPILSNLALNGQRSLYRFDYGDLASKYGVNIINSYVDSVDGNAKSIQLSDGSSLSYDRLVLATGIDFIGMNPTYKLNNYRL